MIALVNFWRSNGITKYVQGSNPEHADSFHRNYSEFLKQAKVVYKVMRLQHKYGEGHCK